MIQSWYRFIARNHSYTIMLNNKCLTLLMFQTSNRKSNAKMMLNCDQCTIIVLFRVDALIVKILKN